MVIVFMSAVMPAPEDGSKPAIVNTVGGASGMTQLYREIGGSRNSAARKWEIRAKLLKTMDWTDFRVSH
jgi:hypothetical protein